MDLETAQSIFVKNATQEDIENAFADDFGRGEFIILTADDGSFIQACGEVEGPYTLEYRDALSNKQFTATLELTKEEVKQAFLHYLRGDANWRESHTWNEIEVSKGCFTVLLYTAVISIGILAGVPLALPVFFGFLMTNDLVGAISLGKCESSNRRIQMTHWRSQRHPKKTKNVTVET
ncbi:MAG: hypothetical protein WD065_18100, partial [Planctomycetaceae bacterium]